MVLRVQRFVPHCRPKTLLCTLFNNNKNNTYQLSDTFTLQLLRSCFTRFGGSSTFGFTPSQIGNRSLRSGAAMALFLMDHHPHKIMILGRWLSEAFLDYIRPQVLEWTNNMSTDMIRFNTFIDVAGRLERNSSTNWKPTPTIFSGSGSILVPQLHLHH